MEIHLRTTNRSIQRKACTTTVRVVNDSWAFSYPSDWCTLIFSASIWLSLLRLRLLTRASSLVPFDQRLTTTSRYKKLAAAAFALHLCWKSLRYNCTVKVRTEVLQQQTYVHYVVAQQSVVRPHSVKSSGSVTGINKSGCCKKWNWHFLNLVQ